MKDPKIPRTTNPSKKTTTEKPNQNKYKTNKEILSYLHQKMNTKTQKKLQHPITLQPQEKLISKGIFELFSIWKIINRSLLLNKDLGHMDDFKLSIYQSNLIIS
jgi:hypothetical protein